MDYRPFGGFPGGFGGVPRPSLPEQLRLGGRLPINPHGSRPPPHTALPAHFAARLRLLVVLSDGKADDFDGCYRASCAIGDSCRA